MHICIHYGWRAELQRGALGFGEALPIPTIADGHFQSSQISASPCCPTKPDGSLTISSATRPSPGLWSPTSCTNDLVGGDRSPLSSDGLHLCLWQWTWPQTAGLMLALSWSLSSDSSVIIGAGIRSLPCNQSWTLVLWCWPNDHGTWQVDWMPRGKYIILNFGLDT